LIKLTVEINVKNHSEIIEKNKGALASGLASLFGGAKSSVEEEIKRQVKLSLQKNIKEELLKNSVKADVSVY
jgi:hypothetical protein